MTNGRRQQEDSVGDEANTEIRLVIRPNDLKRFKPLLSILGLNDELVQNKAITDISDAVSVVSGHRISQQMLYGRSEKPITMSDARKRLRPVLNPIVKNLADLENVGDERWYRFKLFAAGHYSNLKDIQKELQTTGQLEGARSGLRDGNRTKWEADIVDRDLQALRYVIEHAGPRLLSALEATEDVKEPKGKKPGSFPLLVKALSDVFYAHTGKTATVINEKDTSGKWIKRGSFVDFVEAAITSFKLPFSTKNLGSKVDHILHP